MDKDRLPVIYIEKSDANLIKFIVLMISLIYSHYNYCCDCYYHFNYLMIVITIISTFLFPQTFLPVVDFQDTQCSNSISKRFKQAVISGFQEKIFHDVQQLHKPSGKKLKDLGT